MRILIVLFLTLPPAFATDQTVGVRGTLMCGKEPLADAEVKLWESDIWPDPDDLMATNRTDSNGYFEIFGTENEFFTIKPLIKFYHHCKNKGFFNNGSWCKRKVVFEVPEEYIKAGQHVKQWYDMQVMNMEPKARGEVDKFW